MADGYCTVDDVRRALREANLPGDAEQDRDIVIDAIAAQTEWLEKQTRRHWYVSGGITEDTDDLIPTSVNTRDDEHDIPRHGGYVVGAYDDHDPRATATSGTVFSNATVPDPKEEIRLATGEVTDDTIPSYTRIELERKDVDAINTLSVINETGGYDDWVADSSYAGGVGNSNRGDDYWVRINNEGVAQLNVDIHSLDDDLPSLSNGIYIDIDYGHSGLPRTVRRGVAFRAASELVDKPAFQIPDNAQIRSADSLAEQLEAKAEELLSVYM